MIVIVIIISADDPKQEEMQNRKTTEQAKETEEVQGNKSINFRWMCSIPYGVHLRTVPTIVIAHTFCASPNTRISYRQCLPIQGYFCAV